MISDLNAIARIFEVRIIFNFSCLIQQIMKIDTLNDMIQNTGQTKNDNSLYNH